MYRRFFHFNRSRLVMTHEIRKSANRLFRSGKSKDLTLPAQKIELMMISENYKISQRSKIFTVQDLQKCGIKGSHFASNLKRAIDSLKDYEVSVQKEDSVLVSRLVSAAEYHKNGTVEIFFEPKIKPYLMDLKKNFTLFSFNVAMGLTNSKYSLTFYKLFESYLHASVDELGSGWIIDQYPIDDLINLCGLEDSVYSKESSKFIKSVLKPAIDELNKSSNIHVEFTSTKTGRRFTHINFKLKRQMYQPSLNELFQDEITDIPSEIQLTLDEMNYQTIGKSKEFIIIYIVRFGDDIVSKSLKEINTWQDQSFRPKMVKSLLPIYCEKYFEQLESSKKLKKQGVADDKIAKLQKITVKRQDNEFDEWCIMNEKDFKELCDQQIKIFPAMSEYPKLIKKIAKESWLKSQSKL